MHTKNILSLFKEFLYIINDRHNKVMCAKYGRSRMNDACTVCPADFVGLPAKVVWPTTFFSKRKQFLYNFCVGCQLADLGVSTWIAASKLNIYFGIGIYMCEYQNFIITNGIFNIITTLIA